MAKTLSDRIRNDCNVLSKAAMNINAKKNLLFSLAEKSDKKTKAK